MECLEDGCDALAGTTGLCMKHHILGNPTVIKRRKKRSDPRKQEADELDNAAWIKRAKDSQQRILNSDKYFVSKLFR